MTPGESRDPATAQETQPNPLEFRTEISTSGAAGVKNHASAVKSSRTAPLFSVSLNEDAFSNLPYWSMCYEVWYYVLFAAYR